MKICLVYDFLTEFGGLEREMLNHARMLKKAGYEVEILTYHYDKEILEKMNFLDIKVRNIPVVKTKNEFFNIFSSIFLSFLGIYKLKENPDLFIAYSFPANFLVRNKKTNKVNFMNHYPHFLYLGRKEKIEWASSTKGMKRKAVTLLSWFLGDYFRKLDYKLVRNANLNFSNSNFTKRRLDSLYNIESVVSYPPLDPVFKPSRKIINEKFIFCSGRIIPDKKYEWLVESVSYMKNKIPLYLSGQGNPAYISKIKELAKQKKINIKFLGRLSTEDLITYYTSASAFAFGTPKEDFGLVPTESLACGTPVVVWGDGGGPTEQIIDGINGFHAKPYNLKDFAKKLDEILDKDLKNKNKNKIIESAKKFSFEEIEKIFVNKIKSIL